MIIPVILAGGSGTRLWPLSRNLYPKQFLNIAGSNTMLQNTVLRLNGLDKIENPIILCNRNHRFIIAEQLRAINVNPEGIILEPCKRNTAPAVAIAALKALQKGHDPLLFVMPADHHINDNELFYKTLMAGAYLAQKGYLITFGIVPLAPETGYGYIKKGVELDTSEKDKACENFQASIIEKFVEKPNRENALKYVKSGEYFWNSGMFLFKASTVLADLNKFAPKIAVACENALNKGKADSDFFRLDEDSFKACPSDSIDYAVMENTDKGAVVGFQGKWQDLGSWESLWQENKKDKKGNVIFGDVVIHDSKNSFFLSTHRLVAAVGLEEHVVIETPDALFVSPRNRVQDVKVIFEQLKKTKRKEINSHQNESIKITK